jgi:hypothetical protein
MVSQPPFPSTWKSFYAVRFGRSLLFWCLLWYGFVDGKERTQRSPLFTIRSERLSRLARVCATWDSGMGTKKNTKVAAIIPTMTKTIVGLAKLVLLSGGVTDGSMGDWMLVGA